MKSLFRVKYYGYMLSAVALALYVKSGYLPDDPEMQFLHVTLPMMVLGFLVITLRCENCKKGLFDLGADDPKNSFKKLVSVDTYFLPNKCPKCGCQRY